MLQQRIREVLREYAQLDLRKSYLIVGALIVIGVIVNLLFAHGWTVWPFVLAIGILTFINEAVERNGQGLPPLTVYAFFFGAVGTFLAAVMLLSVINFWIVFLGVAFIAYRCAQAYLKQRQRDQLIKTRREQGLCVHCGERFDPRAVLCESCGEEPNPDEAILKRVAGIYRSPEEVARSRAMLTRGTASTAGAKEKALLARRHGGKSTVSRDLPKAAKIGGSSARRKFH